MELNQYFELHNRWKSLSVARSTWMELQFIFFNLYFGFCENGWLNWFLLPLLLLLLLQQCRIMYGVIWVERPKMCICADIFIDFTQMGCIESMYGILLTEDE